MSMIHGLDRDPATGIANPPTPADSKDPRPKKGTKPCLCTSRHTPLYYTTRNFFVQRGETYWLCPTTLACVKDLLKEYAIAGGEPDPQVQAYFTRYVRHLVNRSWYLDKVTRKHAKNRLDNSLKKLK